MKFPKKAIWSSLAVLITISMGLAGCSSGATSTSNSPITSTTGAISTPVTPTSPEVSTPTPGPSTTTVVAAPTSAAWDILNNAISAWSKVTTYHYGIGLAIKMSGSAADAAQINALTISANGTSNVAIKEMQLNASIEIESPGQGKMSIPMAMYLMNGWQYTKVSIPFSGEQWMKSKVDDTSYDAMDEIQHIFKLGQSAAKVTLIGTENVKGVACYVLQIDPDAAALDQWLKSVQSNSSVQAVEPTNADLTNTVKNLSFKEWISQDGYLLNKSEALVTVNMTGAATETTPQADKNLTMDVSETLTVSQYNQPVSIVLPPESQNAQEYSPGQ